MIPTTADDVFIFPASFAQQRLWFLDRLEPETPAYNSPGAIRFNGPLDLTALRATISEVVRRHETLRTTFDLVDEEPAQIVWPPAPVPVPLVDLSGVPAMGRESEARHLALAAVRRSFDLVRGPLLRVTVFRLSAGDDHLVVFTLHHIVCDGWSMGVLMREVGILYGAFSRGLASPLPDLPIQYADFTLWQREWLRGPALTEQVEFWKDRLAGAPPEINLPIDRPRPVVQSYRGGRRRFTLPPDLALRVRELCRQEGATLFMLLLAAFQALLGRHTGQDVILVGTDVANRTRAETEGLIGFFVNQLVIRADLARAASFRELLRQVCDTCLEAFAHQDFPFEMLVDELRVPRDLSRNPLFQVSFVLQNTPGSGGGALPGLALEPVALDPGIAKLDLALTLMEAGDRLGGAFDFSSALFDPPTIAVLEEHLRHLLRGAVEEPDLPLPSLPLLGESERHQLLAGWNDTGLDCPHHTPFDRLFTAAAERSPQAIAALCGGQRITYGELDRMTGSWAGALDRLGVAPGSLTALYFRRGVDLLAAVLAVFKAGGAYVPLDPGHPRERVHDVLVRSGCRLAVAEDALLDDLRSAVGGPEVEIPGLRVLSLSALAAAAGTAPASRSSPGDPAYVIYTSGSTGVPKGATIDQRGMVNHLFAKISGLQLTARDRIAQTASACFDISVWQFLVALLVGGQVHILDDETAHDGARILREVERQGITVLETVPSLLRALLDDADRGSHAAPGGLRLMIATGEALPAGLARHWLETFPKIPLVNAYGPTECSDDVTHHVLSVPPSASALRVPIGAPVANTRLYVLDRALSLVPIGVAGELFVGGVGVGPGYHADPRRTAEAFLPDLFAGCPGARMYRTGDTGRWVRTGLLEFFGRLDHQVKIRGFRIELGEVEAVLARHPDVREAVVLDTVGAAGARRLVAYVVAGSHPPSTAGLRAHLKATLPDPMVPAVFVLVKEFPRTASGKVDRRALAALPLPEPKREEVRAEPRTWAEAELARIWADVLRVDAVGVHDNFFELGGDSILSIQIVSRASRVGLRLMPRQVFEHQTVAELAAVAGTGSRIDAEQGPVTGPLPLTPIQAWLFAQESPEPHHFNQSVLLAPAHTLHPQHLQAALEHLLWHHDGLRLRCASGAAGWTASIAAPEEPAPFYQIDLAALPESARQTALDAACAALQGSLDLTRGPLLRSAWFAGAPGGGVRLLLAIHHLAIDGVSWRVLLDDLQTACLQLAAGISAALPPKTSSVQRWAEALSELAGSAELAAEAGFWRAQAERAERVAGPLPVELALGNNTVASARSVTRVLAEDETEVLLRELPAAYGTQINDALLTALAQALQAWSGDQGVLVALEGHGREEIAPGLDLTRTVGWFTSFYPVLFEPKAASPGEALKATKERLRAIPGHGIGFGLLCFLSGRADVAAAPWPEVSFNYQGQVDKAFGDAPLFALAPESGGPTMSPLTPRAHPLDVNCAVAGGRLRATFTYSGNLHRRTTIEALAESFVGAVRELILHCRTAEAGGYTPADFPLADLDQEQLDGLVAQVEF